MKNLFFKLFFCCTLCCAFVGCKEDFSFTGTLEVTVINRPENLRMFINTESGMEIYYERKVTKDKTVIELNAGNYTIRLLTTYNEVANTNFQIQPNKTKQLSFTIPNSNY